MFKILKILFVFMILSIIKGINMENAALLEPLRNRLRIYL